MSWARSKDFVRHSFILKLRLLVHLRPVYCSCGESQGEAQSGGGSLYLLPSSMLMLRCWIIFFFQNWSIKYGLILGFHVNICFVFFKTWSFSTFLHTRTRKWIRGCISLWSRSSLIFYSPVPPPFTDALSLPSLALEPDGLPHQSKFLESHLAHVCVCACLCVRVHAHVSQHYSVFILRKREKKKIFKEIFCLIHFSTYTQEAAHFLHAWKPVWADKMTQSK